MLPDSTATDLDQHLSNLVSGGSGGGGGVGGGGGSNGGATPTTQMNHSNLLSGGGGGGGGVTTQTSITSSVNGGVVTNGLHIPRYLTNIDYGGVHPNGPRSLSDSSQAESPVQDDLLSTNTPNLGNSGGGGGNGGVVTNQNFTGIVANPSEINDYPSVDCNGSLSSCSTRVLPASLLYSQLYTAANQSHSFHSSSHSLQGHGGGGGGGGNGGQHGELQSVMEHITTIGVGGGGGGGRQQNLMLGTTDLSHVVGNCGSSVRSANDEVSNNRQVVAMAGQRPPHHSDNGNSVWRPY